MPASTSSSRPVTFDVINDTGENYYSTSATASPTWPSTGGSTLTRPSLYNQIGNSGANFLLSVGDIGYNSSNQSNFGDLEPDRHPARGQ